MSKEKEGGISRRKFLGTTAAATAGFTIVPSTVVSGMGHIAPSDKLNIAAVGVGGVGRRLLLRRAVDRLEVSVGRGQDHQPGVRADAELRYVFLLPLTLPNFDVDPVLLIFLACSSKCSFGL